MNSQFRNFDAPKRPQAVSVEWKRELIPDDTRGAPDENDEGFWPSRDAEAPGWVLPENFDEKMRKAKARYVAWERGEWYYVGVCAVATVHVPIGQGSFAIHTFQSAGLWGIESDSLEYINEVFEEEKAELIHQLKQVGEFFATL